MQVLRGGGKSRSFAALRMTTFFPGPLSQSTFSVHVFGDDHLDGGVVGQLAVDDDHGSDFAAGEAEGGGGELGGNGAGGRNHHGDALGGEADVAAGGADG